MTDHKEPRPSWWIYLVLAVIGIVAIYMPLRSISTTLKEDAAEEDGGEPTVGEQPPYFARLRFLNGGTEKVIDPKVAVKVAPADPFTDVPVHFPDPMDMGTGWITGDNWTTGLYYEVRITFEIENVGPREVILEWGGVKMGNVELIVTVDVNHDARLWGAWGQTWDSASNEGWYVATKYGQDPP